MVIIKCCVGANSKQRQLYRKKEKRKPFPNKMIWTQERFIVACPVNSGRPGLGGYYVRPGICARTLIAKFARTPSPPLPPCPPPFPASAAGAYCPRLPGGCKFVMILWIYWNTGIGWIEFCNLTVVSDASFLWFLGLRLELKYDD